MILPSAGAVSKGTASREQKLREPLKSLARIQRPCGTPPRAKRASGRSVYCRRRPAVLLRLRPAERHRALGPGAGVSKSPPETFSASPKGVSGEFWWHLWSLVSLVCCKSGSEIRFTGFLQLFGLLDQGRGIPVR